MSKEKKKTQLLLGMEIEASWAKWAQITKAVLSEIDSNNAAGLALRPEEDLWAAEAVASRYAESETGLKEHQRRQNPVSFLLRRAIKADADAALGHLTTRVAALAARGEGPTAWGNIKVELAETARTNKAKKCLALICQGNAALSWHVANVCLQVKKGDEWPPGYSLALKEVINAEHMELEEEQIQTLARGLVFNKTWGADPETHPAEMALKAAHMQMERSKKGGNFEPLIGALLRAACEPVLIQEKAWALLKEIPKECWPESPENSFDSKSLGFSACTIAIQNRSMFDKDFWALVEFGRKIDPAWVCASRVRDESSARVAMEMAIFFDKASAERPKVMPKIASMEHPLEYVWQVWHHSKRAGRALPEKPRAVALSHMNKTINAWSDRAGAKSVDGWLTTGQWILKELESGRVPARFPGFDSKPVANDAKSEMAHTMSPAAMDINSKETDINVFAWRALAAKRLGFELKETVRQLKSDKGETIIPSWIAEAESLELQDMVRAPTAVRATRRI